LSLPALVHGEVEVEEFQFSESFLPQSFRLGHVVVRRVNIHNRSLSRKATRPAAGKSSAKNVIHSSALIHSTLDLPVPSRTAFSPSPAADLCVNLNLLPWLTVVAGNFGLNLQKSLYFFHDL
jgi:hypothetical protein